jgi:hypothetical protein
LWGADVKEKIDSASADQPEARVGDATTIARAGFLLGDSPVPSFTAQPFAVVSRGEKRRVLFEGPTLPAARGFVEGCRKPTEIMVRVQQSGENVEDLYRIVLLDSQTGQVIAEGPTVNLLDVSELLPEIRVAVLPLCVASKGEIR